MAELDRWKKMQKSMLESRNLKICLKQSTKINKNAESSIRAHQEQTVKSDGSGWKAQTVKQEFREEYPKRKEKRKEGTPPLPPMIS